MEHLNICAVTYLAFNDGIQQGQPQFNVECISILFMARLNCLKPIFSKSMQIAQVLSAYWHTYVCAYVAMKVLPIVIESVKPPSAWPHTVQCGS